MDDSMMKTLMIASVFILTVVAQNANNTNNARINTTTSTTTTTETPATNKVCSRDSSQLNPPPPIPIFPFRPLYSSYNPSFVPYSNSEISYRPPSFPIIPSPVIRSINTPSLRTVPQPYSQWVPARQFQPIRNPSESTSSQWVPVQSYSSQQYARRPSYQQTAQGASRNGAAYQSAGENYQEFEPALQGNVRGSQQSPVLQRPIQQVYFQTENHPSTGAYQQENGDVVQQVPMPYVHQAPIQQVYYRAPHFPNAESYQYDNGFLQQVPVQQVFVMN